VIIVPNHSYRRTALERGGVEGKPVIVVRNGPLRHALVPDTGVPVLPLIGYVGVMGEQDSVDVLLEAASRLRPRYPELRYVLLGDGTHRERYEQYARQLGVDDVVRFRGMVAENAIARELAACSLCVVPDRVNDFTARSTMNKVMEYMALGKPVVQFDTPEGRATAGAACSLYARPNDVADFAEKIAALVDDPERARRMGRRGRARFLRNLCWEQSAEALNHSYDWVLRERGRGNPARSVSGASPVFGDDAGFFDREPPKGTVSIHGPLPPGRRGRGERTERERAGHSRQVQQPLGGRHVER
jgi:glycosyltransferase involved in cell wall biosynthesis